ncbi:DUF1919 domain-containing protein [Ruminococcus sp. HUN007]|uniref:DUF1919 domain-containing protein n=1 Tax=Ruminococcus sp. HUN007 TaxID=1514668 RepID=UPI0005D1ED6F|nr:DUF1919 domain-containing protein [Ruminococcus sp. HUN007]
MGFKENYKNFVQERINKNNRDRLINQRPTLVCSNCTGGFLYHWLKLEFCSPFINLYLTPNDFITMLEDFDNFLEYGIKEVKNSEYDYPLGIGLHDELIHFMHYNSFENAIDAWNRRMHRFDKNNMGIMLTNFGEDIELLKRFEQLPYKNKVCFTSELYPEYKSAYHIKGYDPKKGKNLYATQSITGKRYIDQFDYVEFINHLEDSNG